MISKIKLQKVTSYGESPAVLETDKQINLIYWLNWTWKTTISKYLQHPEESDFSDCSIEGLNDEKILVYNENFIHDNFYQDTQRGIFSLNAENKEAKERIDTLEEEVKKQNWSRENLNKALLKKDSELEKLRTSIQEKTREIKTTYSDQILDFCLEGKKGSKEALFSCLFAKEKPLSQPEVTIEQLKKEAETIDDSSDMHDENEIKKITFDFSKIEENPIFNEVIIGNENSQIAELIKQLDNSNWVKAGIEYITEPQWENGVCPFCQQNTISKELYDKIQNYFDESYQNKVNNLSSLQAQYSGWFEDVKNMMASLLENKFLIDKKETVATLFQSLIIQLSRNHQKINNKVQSPNIVIELESTTSKKDEINLFLDTIIAEIKEYNDKVKNKKDTKKKIIDNFWNIMRWNYDKDIVNYKKQQWKILRGKDCIAKNINWFNKKIADLQKTIRQVQTELVNTKDATDNINNQLMFFWLEGFSIVSSGNEEYKLQRPHQNLAKFETLSEGEKTVISFLYFLELFKGRQSKDEVKGKEIIVIDDPISSLSHMYVFNIAQLIKQNFFNQKDKYEQVFILTHNLYFFHELVNICPKMKDENGNRTSTSDCGLFRTIKDWASMIKKMKQTEIQNDYQIYWQIVKENKNDWNLHKALLANAMRNILEYFFGIIWNSDSLNNTMQSLDSQWKYQFFVRYINRESHNDPINISDVKDVDSSIFQEAFKKIFYDSKYNDHYDKMIK